MQVRDTIPIKKNFAKIVVHVEDCNDHIPVFMNKHYEGTISNLAPAGTEVLRVKALDKDTGSNAEIVYSFHTGKIYYVCISDLLNIYYEKQKLIFMGKRRYKLHFYFNVTISWH